MLNTKKKRWFCESAVPGKRWSKIEHRFLIDKIVFRGRSRYQHILIFDNAIYGRVLVLEGIVQLSESDEYIYHEMITHPAFFSHPAPKNILIIGGGDGGALRECLKHNPESVTHVDIDKKVIELSQKYLPFISRGAFDDKRVTVINEDGKDFIKRYKGYFDIAIIDGEDPVGTSVPLYAYAFYKDLHAALKDNGMAVFQIGSFLDTALLNNTFSKLKSIFTYTTRLRLTMPSYHCGEYCFMAASKKIDLERVDFKDIKARFNKIKNRHTFKYYSAQVHQAALVIPAHFKAK